MRTFAIILVVLLALSEVHGLYLKKDQQRNQKIDQLIRSWNNFCDKLRISNEESPSNTDTTKTQSLIFHEYEALTLIPTLVELSKRNLLLESEKKMLSEIYGNIWSIIEQEAHRQSNVQMNPLLRTILDLLKFLRTEQPFYGSDTAHNTVQQVPKPGFRKLTINKVEGDHPSQRLLNLTAALIRSMESVSRHLANRRRLKRSPVSGPKVHLNLEWTDIPLTKIPRSKRQMTKSMQHHDLPLERIDALLDKLLQDKGLAPTQDYSDTDEHTMEDYFGIVESNDDYAYDDQYEYDDRMPRKTYGGADFENGSFQDLIMLAAQHNLKNRNYGGRRHGSRF